MTLTDNGTLSFATGDTVYLQRQRLLLRAQIVVGNGGLLQATGTAFNCHNANDTNGSNYTQIIVNSGGHLQASGSTFALGQVYLADGVVFNAGDLTGDGFDSPLYIPAIDVQYLSDRPTTSGSRASTIQATRSSAARRWRSTPSAPRPRPTSATSSPAA